MKEQQGQTKQNKLQRPSPLPDQTPVAELTPAPTSLQNSAQLGGLPNHATSRSLRQATVLQMQKRQGNAAVQRMLARTQRQSNTPAVESETAVGEDFLGAGVPTYTPLPPPPNINGNGQFNGSGSHSKPVQRTPNDEEVTTESETQEAAASPITPAPPPDSTTNNETTAVAPTEGANPKQTNPEAVPGTAVNATASTPKATSNAPETTSTAPVLNSLPANAPAPAAPDKEAVAPEEDTFADETTAAGELKKDTADPDKAAPDEKEAAPTESEQKTEGNEASPAPTSPNQDPAFQSVISRGKHVAFQQGHNNPAQQKAMAAQSAARGPANDVASQAAAAQVGKMNAQEPKPFDKKGFKDQLRAKIEEITPKTQDEVNEFKSSNKAATLKDSVTSSVQDSKDKAQGPIEETAKETPDSSTATPKPVTPLPPNEPGAPPPDIKPELAAPKPKANSEISLEEGSKSLDTQMADANVTEEQLEKSNEPDFKDALGAKKDAQTHAKEAPVAYRQDETAVLNNAKNEAATTAVGKMAEMHGVRKVQFGQITTSQTTTKSEDEKKRDAVAKHIEDIYQKTKQKVETRLTKLDTDVNQIFDQGAERARRNFENHVAESETFLAELLQAIGLSDEIQRAITQARSNYIAEMDRVIDRVASAVETGLQEAKALIAAGQQEIAKYVASLPEDLKQVGEKAANDIQGKFDALRQQVDDKKNQLVDSLAQKYVANLQEIDKRVEQLRAENRSWVDKAKDAVKGVIETIEKLKTMLLSTLAQAADAIDKIIKDPIGFLGNLLSAISQGLNSFVSNIGTHLKKGLMTWLFGEAAKAGIQLPETFDLKGILSLALQILGISWANLRARAVNMFGEKIVGGLEKAWEVFQIIQAEGIGGLWQYIKDQLSNLKEMVIDGIKDMVITQVIQAGVKWLIGILGGPAGAFVKAAMAIYDVVMWFVNNGSRLMSLVQAVISSVSAIAAGNISGAAKFVENALAQAIPTVIGFLASLLGLGDLAEKVKGIIQKIQEPVNKAIDWVLGKAKAIVKKLGSLLTGKENKNEEPEGPDTRTPEQKQMDERAATDEATKLMSPITATPEKVQAGFPAIKSKYNLTSLELVNESGPKYHATATISRSESETSELAESKTLAEWLKDRPDLLAEAREMFKTSPEWQGIDPDSAQVTYVPKATVDKIRGLPGESPGHHPHALSLGGPTGQSLTLTGETRTKKNPKHSAVSGLHRRILNEIKRQIKQVAENG